jgi:hypothetical protein
VGMVGCQSGEGSASKGAQKQRQRHPFSQSGSKVPFLAKNPKICIELTRSGPRVTPPGIKQHSLESTNRPLSRLPSLHLSSLHFPIFLPSLLIADRTPSLPRSVLNGSAVAISAVFIFRFSIDAYPAGRSVLKISITACYV